MSGSVDLTAVLADLQQQVSDLTGILQAQQTTLRDLTVIVQSQDHALRQLLPDNQQLGGSPLSTVPPLPAGPAPSPGGAE